jgi:hypothetical protein
MTIPLVKFKFRIINIFVIAFFVANMTILIMTVGSDMTRLTQFIRRFNYLFPTLLAISMISFLIVPLIFKNYKIIGSLRINDSTIKIFESDQLIIEYLISDIAQITFETFDTAVEGGYGVRLGISNWIHIQCKSEIIDKYQLFIANESVLFYLDKQLNILSKDILILKKRKFKTVKSLIIK